MWISSTLGKRDLGDYQARESSTRPRTDLGEGALTHAALQNFIEFGWSSSGPGRVRFFIGHPLQTSKGLGG